MALNRINHNFLSFLIAYFSYYFSLLWHFFEVFVKRYSFRLCIKRVSALKMLGGLITSLLKVWIKTQWVAGLRRHYVMFSILRTKLSYRSSKHNVTVCFHVHVFNCQSLGNTWPQINSYTADKKSVLLYWYCVLLLVSLTKWHRRSLLRLL